MQHHLPVWEVLRLTAPSFLSLFEMVWRHSTKNGNVRMAAIPAPWIAIYFLICLVST